MKRSVAAAVVALAVGLCLSGRSLGADVINKDGFADFLAKVQAAAQTAKLMDPNDRAFFTSIKGMSYDESALEPLKTALAALPSSETGLYTAGRLLAPLVFSDVEVARKALPIVSVTLGRLGKYQALPVYPPDELRSMNLGPDDPKASPEVRLKAISDFADKRQKRLDAEGKVVRTNVQVMILEKMAWAATLRANKPNEDDRVLESVSKYEQDKKATYRIGLAAIADMASQMDQAQAARLYKSLEKTGRALELAEGNYVDPAKVYVGVAENSVFHSPHLHPGVDILLAANAMAGPGKQPAINVPSPEEVSATNMLNRAKALIDSKVAKNIDDGRKMLGNIVQWFPKTKAAEEAARLEKTLPAPPKK